MRDCLPFLAGGKGGGAFIDPDQFLMRIDLADLGWDVAIEWYRVKAHYRYGLRPTGEPRASLCRQIEEQTRDDIPVVRADWFATALARPPLAGDNGVLRKPVGELPESVRRLAQQYGAQSLDREAGARELGVADPRTLRELIRSEEALQQEFDLGCQAGGTSAKLPGSWRKWTGLYGPRTCGEKRQLLKGLSLQDRKSGVAVDK